MVKQTKEGKTAVLLLTLLTAVLVAISTVFLVKKTEFATALSAKETRSMLFELFVVFTLLFISLWHPIKKWLSYLICIVVTASFLWIHQALLPVLAAGLYVLYLCLLGSAVTGGLFTGKRTGAAGFITGAAVQIVIVALFSVFGIGGAKFFLIQSLICLVLLLILNSYFVGKNGKNRFSLKMARDRYLSLFPEFRLEGNIPKDGNRLIFCLLMALIGTAFLLQAGRIGICLDYDSLHYGFRSAYVLDNGYGIYENLGSVNDVYVYPKGFETLTLPLSGFGSGAFVSAVSWWMTLAAVSASAAVVNRMRKERRKIPAGLFAAAVICTVPGIMNMAVSAKTDAVTLAVQMVMILCFLSGDRADWWTALAAAFLSLTFKPTAFLFSFLLTVVGIGLCVYRVRKEKKAGTNNAFDSRRMVPALFALAAALFVTVRTVQLAGVPLTTAGSGLWNALGFEMKYPFNGASIAGGTEKSFLKRLIGLFACPAGEDMSHVYIAWGGLSVTICLVISVLCAVFRSRKEKNAARNALMILLFITAVASLTMLRTLWQVDGNYFMLLYVLSVVCAYVQIGSVRKLTTVLTPAMLLGIAMCIATNWAGAKGLTPVKLVHAGFPEQQKEQRLILEAEGKGEIYALLAEDPRNRVLAMADQPACFAFPCNVQSYTDLEGSGGNVKLVKTLDDFKNFLDYAGTDYIYVEQDFLASRERAADIVRYMLEDGSLVEERRAEGTGAALYRYTGVR